MEPRLSLLILAGLDLSCSHSTLLLDSGPEVWEPRVEAPLYTARWIGTIRKILQDVDSSTMDIVTLSKQTLQEVFYPEHDDGFKLWHNNTKKKKKVCKL